MIDKDTLDAVVREKGPTCPAFDCDHSYCQVMRTLRDALEQPVELVLATTQELEAAHRHDGG